MIRNYKQLLEKAKSNKTMRLACVAAEDADSIKSLYEAECAGLTYPVLFGDKDKIAKVMAEENITYKNAEIVHCADMLESAAAAVQYIKDGKADFIMKGLIDTNYYLKAIINKETGLPVPGQLNHVMTFYAEGYYDKIILTSDGGMLLYPTLEQKDLMIKNSIIAAKALDIDPIKVAVLCAKEKVNAKMPPTIDAAELKKYGDEGRYGKNVFVDGPVALDLAINAECARVKGYSSPVAGDADILIFPSIEAGNIFGKTFTSIFGTPCAGVVVGTTVPVVLTSRADSDESKLYSIALGSVMASSSN
jgi:phosphate butyryltransferase